MPPIPPVPCVPRVASVPLLRRLALLLLTLCLLPLHAAYSPTTGMTGAADEDINELSPSDTSGNRAFLELRSRSVEGSNRHRIAYFRFNLAGLAKPITAASLRFWIASSTTETSPYSIDVFGVVDGVPGEHDWSASSLSYNSAPGLTTADHPNIDRDHEPGQTVLLGTVSYPGSGYSGGLSLTGQALLDFLNSDTNGSVTLFLEPQIAATGEDFFVHVRAAEGVGSDPGDFASTLDLPNSYPPGEEPPPPPGVTLTNGDSQITLANGLIQAIFSKTNGRCTDLRLGSGNNLLLNGGQLYLDSNSGGGYFSFSGSPTVVESTSERAHLRFNGRMGEFDIELNYVLHQNTPGFHTYVVFRHGAGDAATYLEQARMVLRVDKNVFTKAFTSETKTGQMISPALLASAPTIMDATQELPAMSDYTTPTGLTDDGLPVYSKYDWADLIENHTVHGLSSDTLGLWMITGSQEYMNGGPTKGELFVHGTNTTPLMIQTFHAGHFVGSDSRVDLAADQPWEKIFGPYFIYLNQGASAEAVWQDARIRAAQEKQAWPLAWMNEPTYPTARGTVSGQVLARGAPGSNALVVLAKPGTDWQAQGADYLFWTRADSQGRFTVPDVRPASYSLRVIVPGISGEMAYGPVDVQPSASTELGSLAWTPPNRATTLWQIGTPDRSAAEFRFGSEMRQYGLWWRYLEERGAADLNYTIGTSTPANWYYAQMVAPLDDGRMVSPKWNILFNLNSVPAGACDLVLDFAGTMSSTLNVTLNGVALGTVTTPNDGGIYRSATSSSRYLQRRITFDASRLGVGSNVLSLQLAGGGTWTGTKAVSPRAGVMYDAIRLETGALASAAVTPVNAAFYLWSSEQAPRGALGFDGDGDANGVPDGFEFAFGPLVAGDPLLHLNLVDGVPAASLARTATGPGAAHTDLLVEATTNLNDWSASAVPLTQNDIAGNLHWFPQTSTRPVFFRLRAALRP